MVFIDIIIICFRFFICENKVFYNFFFCGEILVKVFLVIINKFFRINMLMFL